MKKLIIWFAAGSLLLLIISNGFLIWSLRYKTEMLEQLSSAKSDQYNSLLVKYEACEKLKDEQILKTNK